MIEASLCVGGPMHGQHMTSVDKWFRVYREPSNRARFVADSDEPRYLDYEFGSYELIPINNPEPISVWLWKGWQ